MRISTLDDPFASDDEVDQALGIPTMRDVLGRGDTTPDNFALPTDTDYETGEQMPNDTTEQR